ncbi:MAG: hypothetical protein GY884_06030, partial [Proteobacteria bacterium]|nr:hypothetical protein [Pseudomonadota bacterium]
ELHLELSQAAIDELSLAPKEYVVGTLLHGDDRYEDVGIRLKGNSSYRWLTHKAPLKVKFHHVDEDQRFHDGIERLTLNSNVHDPSMMAETLAYRLYGLVGSPSPRTGYARVWLNDVSLGLYTIVESMDDEFVDEAWPGSTGSLYEPERGCDLDDDPSCYELEQAGDSWTEDELRVVHEASGSYETLSPHVDWDRVLAYLAVERFAQHRDSYSFNGNNHHLFFEPKGAQVSLSPWGADSTFVYRYPVDEGDYDCVSTLSETLGATPTGILAMRCGEDPGCAAALDAEISRVAQLVEDEAYWELVAEVAEVVRDDVLAEPRTSYTAEQFDDRVACHAAWIQARVDAVR